MYVIKRGRWQLTKSTVCNIMDRVKNTTLRLIGKCIALVEKSLEAIELSTTLKSRASRGMIVHDS